MRRLYVIIICVFLGFGCEHKNTKTAKSGDFYLKQGNKYWSNEEYDKAIAEYTKAIERYKDSNDKAFAYSKRSAVILHLVETKKSSFKKT